MPKHLLAALAVCAALAAAPPARAGVSEDNFVLRSTADLVSLCGAAPADPLYTAAQNFCQGFAIGVYRVLAEEQAAEPRLRNFCMPDPTPSRNDAMAAFLQWAQATPAAMTLPPADGVLDFLAARFPCPKGK